MQQSSATPSLHLCFSGLRKIVACSQPYLAVLSCIYSFWHGVIPTSYFIFNDFYTCTSIKMKYIGCRDDTVPKTRRPLRGGVRAYNNLPQPPKTKDVGIGLRKIVACSHSSSQCLLVPTVFGTVSSLHPTSIFILVSLIFYPGLALTVVRSEMILPRTST